MIEILLSFRVLGCFFQYFSTVLPDVRKSGRSRFTSNDVNKFIPKKCKTATYERSFLVRECRIWNCLVDELDFSSVTVASFKSVLFSKLL